ncbi:hypothetical protein [Lysobacter sp.]|uniref:hypothetical protein n=1 Tax=Lysobacter sp. TaxID=72226 RepID=UPI002D220F62|nr:hypothetical protein [Lysobacter sp.]HZX77288.1 hypothetical protein [Lysobacter sp.]
MNAQEIANGGAHDWAADLGEAMASHREDLDAYVQALEQLPTPPGGWEPAAWLLVAVGEVNFLAREYECAAAVFAKALRCHGTIGYPFVHLRLGQCHYELGELVKAGEELVQAYRHAGFELFTREDPKYFVHLKTALAQPRLAQG